jgi:D-alanyl-D-alanine carboxypeptidase/D-alanyl-D-alanine-endopeptidase (penicillin-binding protein 4)
VSALVEAARLGGRRSIVILDLASGVVLHDDSGATELVPASNTKLFTTAAALDTLGDDHRLETRLVARGTVDANGTLVGDLVLESGEDFTWSMRDDKHPGTIVDELVARAYATGLRRVDGQARAAGTFFVEGSRGAEYDERAHRATAGAMLANALQKQRIAVSRAKHPAGAPTALAAVASPPLLEAATIINRRSHNGFAEVLFRHLGARAGSTTSETGARALDSWLRSVSIDGAPSSTGPGFRATIAPRRPRSPASSPSWPSATRRSPPRSPSRASRAPSARA